MLLPDASLINTLRVAERVRVAAAQADGGNHEGVVLAPVTVSVGVAEMQSGDTLAALIATAEAALYRAKFNGRNRVEIAAERATERLAQVLRITG